MTDTNTPPAGDTAASATAPATGSDHMIPKARLDEEIAKRKAADEALSKIADDLAAEVPEAYRALVPASLGPAERIAWIRSAKATGLFGKATVPNTDTAPPSKGSGKKEVDLSTLPPMAKIAAGYAKT